MLAIIWILLGVVLLAFYNSLLILDGAFPQNTPEPLLSIKNKIKKGWHIVGASIMIYLSLTACLIWGFKYSLLCFALFWTLFAGIVHKIALLKPFFFVGTTAFSDKLLRKYFPNNTERASAVLKISTLIISLIIVFIW